MEIDDVNCRIRQHFARENIVIIGAYDQGRFADRKKKTRQHFAVEHQFVFHTKFATLGRQRRKSLAARFDADDNRNGVRLAYFEALTGKPASSDNDDLLGFQAGCILRTAASPTRSYFPFAVSGILSILRKNVGSIYLGM